MAVTTEIRESVRVRAWFGTVDDLKKLLEVVESSFKDDREAAKRALKRPSPRFADYGREGFARAWSPTASATTKQRHDKKGPIFELISETGPDDLRDLSYIYPGYGADVGSRVTLMFDLDNGLRITITGDSHYRVTALKAVITEQAQRRRPWWTWLLATAPGAITMYAVLVAFFSILGVLVSSHVHNSVAELATVLAGSSTGPSLFYVTRWRRVSPLFEVLSGSETAPKALRTLKAIGGLMVTLAAGLVVAFATK